MPDYQQGKIYKLCGAGKTYIGSTIQPLSKRHWVHKCAKIATVQEIITDPNHQITLIELFPCSCKEELLARERFHIENIECINKIRRPILMEGEKKLINKEYQQTPKHKEYKIQYRQNPENKERFKKYMEVYKQTEKYIESTNKYEQKPERKEKRKQNNALRRQTPEYKEYSRQYYLRKKAEKLALQQN